MSKSKTAPHRSTAVLVTEEQELLKKLENLHSKRSLEIVSTFLPDHILKSPKNIKKYESHFVVLLLVEISGITSLCEKYNKVGSGGTNCLTICLNTYIGAIVEIIYFYGGDVLNFTGDEVMACWKNLQERSKVIHQVIVCAMYIQEMLGDYETEINVQLKMKIAICYGDACFFVIGEHSDKELVVTGSVTEDIKFVKSISTSGDVVLSAATWRCLPVQYYSVTPLAQGFVKLLNCEYFVENETQLQEDREKRVLVDKLCDKHFQHRNNLFRKKQFEDTVTEVDIQEEFVRSLPQRTSINMAVKRWQPYDLKPFVMKLIQTQLDSRLSVGNLTEIREITVQYINVMTTYKSNFIQLLDGIYKKVHDIVSQYLGVVINVSILDKDVTMLVAYGTKTCRQELESKNALVSAYKINESIVDVTDVKTVSIGIANGYVYSGVIGHPMRKEFIIVGKVVTRAAKLMCSFPGKIVCDFKTYKNSKLSTQYFRLLPSSEIKLEDSAVFEYRGLFDTDLVESKVSLIGRDDESDLILTIVNHPDKINYFGICFHGEHKIGKSRLLQYNFSNLQKDGYAIVSVELSRYTRRPYFCISNLYKQLYNLKSTVDGEEFVFVKDLPSDLWDFSEILQDTLHCKDSYAPVQRKFRILSLFREMTRNCETGFAVIFIDDIQYIDQHSFDILETVIGEGFIRIVCAGRFDEEFWDTRFRISLSNHIKLFELSPLRIGYVPRLVCDLLEVSGVSTRLIDAIDDKCDLNPGLIESVLLKMLDDKSLKIEYVSDKYRLASCYCFVERDETFNVAVGLVPDNFDFSSRTNIQTFSSEIVRKMSPFKLSLVKTCAALGDIFSRLLLKLIFKYSSEYEFSNAIASLFEDGIFDCGFKCLTPDGLSFKGIACYCAITNEYDLQEDKKFASLPLYSFCQIIHFKNHHVKRMAYELLNEEERKNLHLKITEVLESQNHSCSNCLRNNSAPMVVIPKFREVSFLCNKIINYKCDHFAQDIDERKNQSGESVWDTKNLIGGKRKIWDSTICSCLDMLVQVYTDLVNHSTKARHIEKTIYFSMQKGFIMTLMNEFEEAIAILRSANDLCTGAVKLDQNFRDLHLAKINLLMARAYLSLSDGVEAKKHLLVSLRVYEITVVPSAPGYRFFQTSKIDYEDEKIKLKNSMIQNDFGTCLNLISSLFAHDGDWEMAKIASNQCVAFLNDHLASVSVLCEIYSNAISIHSFVGDDKTCEKFEKNVTQHILKKFNSNVIYDLFSISKLIYSICHTRFVNAHVDKAIRLGYWAVDLNNSIHACRIQIDVITILSTALLYVKRVEDSVEVVKILYNIGRRIDEFALLAYFSYCMELILETSFYLEPIEDILLFAQSYFATALNNKLTLVEEALLLNLYDFFVRNSRWGEIYRWKKYVEALKFPCDSVQSVKNLLRYTETLLISYIRNEALKKHLLDDEKIKIKGCLKQCEEISNKWKIFKPRYLHLRAYYCRVMDRKNRAKRYLKQAQQFADQQGNILEKCWLTQSENSWNGGFSFEGDRKCIEWKMAKTYTPLHWSQILYGLPLHL